MEDLKHRSDYWKRVLCRDGLIDMDGLHAALAAAISREACPVEASMLAALWQAQTEPADARYLIECDGRRLAKPQLIYLHYAEFSVAIGAALGLSAADSEFADEWVESGMRETRAVISALTELVIDCLGDAEREMKDKCGYSPGEILVRAVNTGESLGQAAARLHHEANGLRPVEVDD